MLKRSTFLAALAGAALLSTSLIAGETTKTDRDALVAHLKKTEAAFLKSIDGLSEAQWKWKPAPDRWSVAEAAEHITKSEDLLRGAAEGTLKAPATPEFLAKTKGKEAAESFEEKIEEHPLIAIGAAFGLGLLVGALLRK